MRQIIAGQGRVMKVCTKCGQEKARSEFHRDKSTLDGHVTKCKVCANEDARKWAAANPDKKRESDRRWREANPERVQENQRKWVEANPERVQENQHKWYKANQESHLEKVYKWREANPDKVAKSNSKWKKNNRDKVLESHRASTNRRKDRMAALPNDLTDLQFLVILTYYRFGCAYCGKPWQEEDHVIPVVQFGGRTKENIVPVCRRCNQRKGPRTPGQAGMSLRVMR